MGSALIFVGIGIVMYVIVLGVLMMFTPAILGAVFTTVGDTMDNMDIDPAWAALFDEEEALALYLIPMMFSLLIVLLVIKVLMVAGVRGGD
jgi:hypothetical protein